MTEHVCCEECGRALEIVCPNGHADPMEMRRKSKGPVPSGVPIRAQRPPRSIPTEKRCTRCETVKPVAEFYLHRGRPMSNCKRCWNEYLAERKKDRATT